MFENVDWVKESQITILKPQSGRRQIRKCELKITLLTNLDFLSEGLTVCERAQVLKVLSELKVHTLKQNL